MYITWPTIKDGPSMKEKVSRTAVKWEGEWTVRPSRPSFFRATYSSRGVAPSRHMDLGFLSFLLCAGVIASLPYGGECFLAQPAAHKHAVSPPRLACIWTITKLTKTIFSIYMFCSINDYICVDIDQNRNFDGALKTGGSTSKLNSIRLDTRLNVFC